MIAGDLVIAQSDGIQRAPVIDLVDAGRADRQRCVADGIVAGRASEAVVALIRAAQGRAH